MAPDLLEVALRRSRRLHRCAALLALALAMLAPSAEADDELFHDKLISLGTASLSGTFYPLGGKLCELVNRDRKLSSLRCVTYRSPGSDYNTKAVVYGDLTIGMTRSDIAYEDFTSHSGVDFYGGTLRAVMSLYPMPVMVIASRASAIRDLSELPGHSFNLGNRGSGQRSIADMLLRQLKLDPAALPKTTELNTTAMGDAFCAGDIDVIVEALGNPAPFYRRMIEECDGRILSMPPAMIDAMLAANPQLERMTIPGGVYAENPEPIASVGYKALLVASTATSGESIRRFLGSVLGRLPELRAANPALANLDPQQMFSDGVTIPLHEGVKLYLTQTQQAPNVFSSAK